MPSPIELQLYRELLAVAPTLYDATNEGSIEFEHSDAHESTGPWRCNRQLEHNEIYLFAQARLLGYKADFAICCDGRLLLVECDGFEHHERTKQQASYDRARDRELVRCGASVIRFTGSEIYSDVNRCARAVKETWNGLSAELRRTWRIAADEGRRAGIRVAREDHIGNIDGLLAGVV